LNATVPTNHDQHVVQTTLPAMPNGSNSDMSRLDIVASHVQEHVLDNSAPPSLVAHDAMLDHLQDSGFATVENPQVPDQPQLLELPTPTTNHSDAIQQPHSSAPASSPQCPCI
jgi:hypothetical protein